MSKRLNIGLQFFADEAANADAVVDAAPEVPATPETAEPTTAEPTPTAEPKAIEQPIAEPQKDITQTQAFAKRLKEVEQRTRDEIAKELFGDQGYDSWDKVQKAREEAKRQADLDRLVQQNIPKEYAEKLMEVENLKRWKTEQETARQQKEQADAENAEFFETFKQHNGREFTTEDANNLEAVVQLKNERNVPLSVAYEIVKGKEAIEKLKGVDTGKKTAEANAANATTATGSVTGNGQAANSVLTDEMVANMSPAELSKRWSEVKKLYNMK